MADIFSRTSQKIAGSFTVDATRISFGAFFGVGLITQQLGLQYAQRINRLYEVGTNNVYYVVGVAEGTVNMSRIVGPTAAVSKFYKKFGDACNSASNTVELTAGSSFCSTSPGASAIPSNSITYTMSGMVITTIGMTVAVPDMTINEQVAALFVNLSVKNTGPGGDQLAAAGGLTGGDFLNPGGALLNNFNSQLATIN